MGVNEKREDALIIIFNTFYKKSFALQEAYPDRMKAQELFLKHYQDYESIDDVKKEFAEWIDEIEKSYKRDTDENNVKDNHRKLVDKLKRLVEVFNEEDIDYRLAGALNCFLGTYTESNFVHNVIDIYINQDDVDKLQNICSRFGVNLIDKRMDSDRKKKGNNVSRGCDLETEEVDGIKIRFHTFKKNEDNTITVSNYYKDAERAMVQETTYPSDAADVLFGKNTINVDGTLVLAFPVEASYLAIPDTSHNWKDQRTKNQIGDKIDPKKLGLIQNAVDSRTVEDMPAKPKKEEGPVLQKKPGENALKPSSEEGFISNTIITTLTLITFVLCAIGLTIIYLIK